MPNISSTAIVIGLSLLSSAALRAQAPDACDLNGDGKVNIADVQLAANMALGWATCRANVAGSGVCNPVVVQRVIDAVLTGTCVTGDVDIQSSKPDKSHGVSLNWTASTSTDVSGYNVYRGSASGGPYTKLTSSPVAPTTFTDNAVLAGQTYFYVVTAVDAYKNESTYSNQAQAVIPKP